MKVKYIAEALGANVAAGEGSLENEAVGCYIGDLLSRVIGRAVHGGVWITIMPNVNVAAVALLAEVACIVLAESVRPDDNLVRRCAEEDIPLLLCDDDAYTAACKIHSVME